MFDLYVYSSMIKYSKLKNLTSPAGVRLSRSSQSTGLYKQGQFTHWIVPFVMPSIVLILTDPRYVSAVTQLAHVKAILEAH